MKQLPATAMRSNGADYTRAYHHVSVDNTVSVADILRPNFWAHHYSSLRPGDLVDVLSPLFDVQLRVVEKGIGFVKMRPRIVWTSEEAPVEAIDAPTDLPSVPDGYDVKRGPRGLWRVFTKEPHLEIKGGILTEREAIQIAADHAAKAMA